jgi:hypothetical protein
MRLGRHNSKKVTPKLTNARIERCFAPKAGRLFTLSLSTFQNQ